MKPIYNFVNAHLIPKIKEFIDEAENTPMREQCAVILAHLKKIESDKKLDELKAAFEVMKELGSSSKVLDQKSARLIKNLVSKFDDSFYKKLEEVINNEVKASAGIFSVFVPQSKVINGIKTALGDQGAQGDNYGTLMKSIFDRAFLNSLRIKTKQ